MPTYVAIDIGTSSTKLSAYDEAGAQLAACSAKYGVEFPHSGWAEQDSREWWLAVRRLGPELMSRLKGRRISAIGISGQTPLCVPIDRSGHPLRKAILWLDRRAAPQAQRLAEQLTGERVREITGNRFEGLLRWTQVAVVPRRQNLSCSPGPGR